MTMLSAAIGKSLSRNMSTMCVFGDDGLRSCAGMPVSRSIIGKHSENAQWFVRGAIHRQPTIYSIIIPIYSQ